MGQTGKSPGADTYPDRPTAVVTRKNKKPYNPYGEDFLVGDQASSESKQETIPVSPDIEVDDDISGDTLLYAITTTIIEQPKDFGLREVRIEEWLKKQDSNISHLLPEVYEEESERTSSAATKTKKDNPRQWKLPEGAFYFNMMMKTKTPKGKLVLFRPGSRRAIDQ